MAAPTQPTILSQTLASGVIGAVTYYCMAPHPTSLLVGAVLGIAKTALDILKRQKIFEGQNFIQSMITMLSKELVFLGFLTFSPFQALKKVSDLASLCFIGIEMETFCLMVSEHMMKKLLPSSVAKKPQSFSTWNVLKNIPKIFLKIFNIPYKQWILYLLILPLTLGVGKTLLIQGTLLLFFWSVAKAVFGKFFIEQIHFCEKSKEPHRNKIWDFLVDFRNFSHTILFTSLYFVFFFGMTYRSGQLLHVQSMVLKKLLLTVTLFSCIDLFWCLSTFRDWMNYKINPVKAKEELLEKLS